MRRQRHDVDDRPFIVIWEVTRACQLACAHCRADAMTERNPLELSLDEGRRLLEEIASFPAPHPIVVLTGGDPFEREDLEDLVAHGTSLGLTVALSPSVTPRLTPGRLAGLHAAGAKAVSLSLDGAQPETHDRFRGFSGTFADTLTAARWTKEEGLRLQINSTVTARTVDELPELLTRVLDMGASLWSVFFLVPTGRGQDLDALTPEQVEDVMHWLVDVSHHIAIKTTEAPHYRRVVIERARLEGGAEPVLGAAPGRGALYTGLAARTAQFLTGREVPHRPARPPIDVNSGRGFMFVDHVGWVYPSGFLPQRVGHVRESSVVEIYRDSPLMRSLRRPAEFSGKCGVCEYREVCGGSRSHAYAVTHDPLASDPTCAYQPVGDLAAR